MSSADDQSADEAEFSIDCECGKRFAIHRDQAGGRFTCSCGHLVQIPGLHHLRLGAARLQESAHSKESPALWQAAETQGTVESYERYLSAYPDGRHAAKAKEIAAARLRSLLMADLLNVSLRRRYLAVLDDKCRKMDAESVPVAWRLRYLFFALLVSVPNVAIVGMVSGLLADYLGEPWVFRVPCQAVVGFILGAILGNSAGRFLQQRMASEEGREREKGWLDLARVPILGGGLIAGAIGGWLAGAITGTIMGMNVGFFAGRGTSAKKFGPLPYGAHPMTDSDLRKIYLRDTGEAT